MSFLQLLKNEIIANNSQKLIMRSIVDINNPT